MAGYDIYSMLGRGVRSVGDYDREAAALQGAQLQNQQNQVALALQQRKQAEFQRAQDEQNLLRDALKGATTDQELVDRARATGLPSGLELADQVSKRMLEQQKTQSDAAFKDAETKQKTYQLGRNRFVDRVGALSQFESPEDAKQWLADGVANGAFSMKDATKMIQSVPPDPESFNSWRQKKLLSVMSPEKQTAITTPSADEVLKAKTSAANNATTNARIAAEGEANRQLRQDLNASKNQLPKPPKDMRYDADGNLEPIPGSVTDRKIKDQKQKTQLFIADANDRFDSATKQIDALLKSPALGAGKNSNSLDVATGAIGVIAGKFYGDARDFNALKESLVAKLAFQELQKMRAASPSGGALGNVTDKDMALLQSAVENVTSAQSGPALQKALQELKVSINNAKARMTDAASADIGEPIKNNSKPVTPKSANPLGASSVIGNKPKITPTVSNWNQTK